MDQLPKDVQDIIYAYKREMERLDAFHDFLAEVFGNLIRAMKSK